MLGATSTPTTRRKRLRAHRSIGRRRSQSRGPSLGHALFRVGQSQPGHLARLLRRLGETPPRPHRRAGISALSGSRTEGRPSPSPPKLDRALSRAFVENLALIGLNATPAPLPDDDGGHGQGMLPCRTLPASPSDTPFDQQERLAAALSSSRPDAAAESTLNSEIQRGALRASVARSANTSTRRVTSGRSERGLPGQYVDPQNPEIERQWNGRGWTAEGRRVGSSAPLKGDARTADCVGGVHPGARNEAHPRAAQRRTPMDSAGGDRDRAWRRLVRSAAAISARPG